MVVSIIGNHGQSHFFKFYNIEDNRISEEVSGESLGMEKIKENDFLTPDQYFEDQDNYSVDFYIGDEGVIESYPWTWMNPKWEDKNIVKEILFVWNGITFQKKVINILE